MPGGRFDGQKRAQGLDPQEARTVFLYSFFIPKKRERERRRLTARSGRGPPEPLPPAGKRASVRRSACGRPCGRQTRRSKIGRKARAVLPLVPPPSGGFAPRSPQRQIVTGYADAGNGPSGGSAPRGPRIDRAGAPRPPGSTAAMRRGFTAFTGNAFRRPVTMKARRCPERPPVWRPPSTANPRASALRPRGFSLPPALTPSRHDAHLPP